MSKASVARCGKDRDKDSVTSDLRLRVKVERSPRVSSFQFRVSLPPITDHRSLVTGHRSPISARSALVAALVDRQDAALIDANGDANG